MQKREKAGKILEILKREFSVPQLSSITKDPFKVLVRTIISQSTAEVNTRRAYQNLSETFPITPEAMDKADLTELEKTLRVAGLYRNKAKVLKNVAKVILEKFNGSLDFVHSLPLSEARKNLMDLPGVGPKTADIVLLFCANRSTLPVDTHVNRVSKRLGLVPSEAGYEDVRKGLQELYSPEEYFSVHMLFIALGRDYCKALRPLHAVCPLRGLCPSAEF